MLFIIAKIYEYFYHLEVFTVTSDSVDNQGLKFCVGDRFVVLESDKDAILIEKIGDSHNPYFVSAEFLHSISDFVNLNN